MKLIYIIVSSDDDDRGMEQLNKNGFSGTKMATTGGFLRSGNTTLFSLPQKLAITSRVCRQVFRRYITTCGCSGWGIRGSSCLSVRMPHSG